MISRPRTISTFCSVASCTSLGKFADLRAVLLIGGAHVQGRQVSQRVDSDVDLGTPLRRLAPS